MGVKYFLTSIFAAVLLAVGFILTFLIIKTQEVKKGRDLALSELEGITFDKLSGVGKVKHLSVLPLVEFDASDNAFKTENGVSYLIKADSLQILLDVGLNRKKEHPSPLIHNMERLGISSSDIDMIVISHLHADHVGGMSDCRNKTFSLSQGAVDLQKINAYVPEQLKPSEFNPMPTVQVIKEPIVLSRGVASIGVIPRYLFVMGYILEQSLAINVEGKGVVLIIGCGHQTIEKIIERTQMLFAEPIYAIIGGLHFPINKPGQKNFMTFFQHTVGSDSPPWKGIKDEDVNEAIEAIKRTDPSVIGISPHDSSSWSIQQFKEAFQDKYVDIKVGKKIII